MDLYVQNLLKVADASIANTKQVLKFGLGNIIEDIRRSNSQSLGPSDFAREIYAEAVKNDSTELEKTMLRATASKIAQGGNCHEAASLVFANLMSMIDNITIQLCRKKMDENPQDYHVYVRIVSDKHDPIIVDEWGSNSKAFLSNYDDDDEVIVMHEEVTNSKNKLLRKSEFLIKKTDSYKYKQRQIKSSNGSSDQLFETSDNLQYLEEDKYIGVRMIRAYNDPGLK